MKWDCYVEMFAAAGGDFQKLYDEAVINERGERVIPFQDYSLTQEQFDSILLKYKNKLKSKWEKQAFSDAIHLGCSPKIKQHE